MLEIVDLLEKLKQLDEPTYKKIARGIQLQPCGQYMVFDRGEVRTCQYHEAYMPFGNLLPEVAEAWLQFCIQRALVDRGWPVILSFDCDPDRPKTWDVEICNGLVDGLLGRANGLSLCATLLACYIACLEGRP
ncbi:hypothetical protein M0R72_22060 [Candidatus Pacearchaeota archaeon]|jgi:hypothetical protein|nr:hypothetical protein [Candidatus Pacearchaeota archaeon]